MQYRAVFCATPCCLSRINIEYPLFCKNVGTKSKTFLGCLGNNNLDRHPLNFSLQIIVICFTMRVWYHHTSVPSSKIWALFIYNLGYYICLSAPLGTLIWFCLQINSVAFHRSIFLTHFILLISNCLAANFANLDLLCSFSSGSRFKSLQLLFVFRAQWSHHHAEL